MKENNVTLTRWAVTLNRPSWKLFIFGSTEDITKRKKSEDELVKYQEKLFLSYQ